MDNLEIRSKLEVILGLLSTAMDQAKKLQSDLEPKETEETEKNIYIRSIKRLNPDLFYEIENWKEVEGSPGLELTLRDGRKALITFSVDLMRYHVLIREEL